MDAAVQPILTPDAAAMRRHLEHLFGGFLDGYQDGKIELAWTHATPDASGRYPLAHGEAFDTDDDSIDELVAKAVELNSTPRTNVYVGAALQLPDRPKHGRGQDEWFYAATATWCDLDDDDANRTAKNKFTEAVPTLVVQTGKHPHSRHQMWWRTTEVIADPERIRSAVAGIAAVFGGDGTVANPSRVMRLAGSIAWDQKPGRRPELTTIVPLKAPGLPVYVPEHLERVYPPLVSLAHARVARNAPGPNVGIVRERIGLGFEGKVIDGRERHMTNVICARLIDYCGQFGAAPTADELFEHAWDSYERSTDLQRPGRNKHEFAEKCRSTMRRFELGKIRGAETLERAVVAYRERRQAKQENTRHEARTSDDPEFTVDTSIFEYLDIAGIKALPDPNWIVKDMIIEDALGFIYGPPGHGKTFVALSLALHVSYGALDWWWGKQIKRPGFVLYIAREGQAGFKNRIEAWQRANGIADDKAPFALMRAGINFMDARDVEKLIRTVHAASAALGATPSLIVVDTVSRVLPGADENLQKEMTIFVAACDALRDAFKATVIGVHHAGKSGDMRGSTVLKGAGDFVFKVEKEDAEEGGTAVKFEAEKIKDAEDGWTKGIELMPVEWVVEGAIDGERKSMVAVPLDENAAKAPAEGWPEKAVCRRVLASIQEAWSAGRPWSPHARAHTEGKYAVARIVGQFGVSRGVAEQMISAWLNNDVLAFVMVDTDSKMKGLKVVGSID